MESLELKVKHLENTVDMMQQEMGYLRDLLYEFEKHHLLLLAHLHIRPTHHDGQYGLEDVPFPIVPAAVLQQAQAILQQRSS